MGGSNSIRSPPAVAVDEQASGGAACRIAEHEIRRHRIDALQHPLGHGDQRPILRRQALGRRWRAHQQHDGGDAGE